MKYNTENRINKCKGYVSLLDFEERLIACKKFNTKKMRKEIISFWNKTYRLEDKSYYIIISPQ